MSFAVFAEHATGVDVVLFDKAGQSAVANYPLTRGANGVWCTTVSDAGIGTIYGFRADGPYDPSAGHPYQPKKLLLDPYAQQIVGQFAWSDVHLDTGYEGGDNSACMVKAQVVDREDFDWADDRQNSSPRIPHPRIPHPG